MVQSGAHELMTFPGLFRLGELSVRGYLVFNASTESGLYFPFFCHELGLAPGENAFEIHRRLGNQVVQLGSAGGAAVGVIRVQGVHYAHGK